MKIGIDARAAKWYRGTGIGTYTYQLINSLNNIDNLNDYLLFIDSKYKNDITFNKNFTLKTILDNNEPQFWDQVNNPNALIDTCLNLYHVPQNGVGLPKDKHCPFVITLHDTIPLHMPETVGERYLSIFNKNMEWIVKNSDGIITVSNFSKEDIAKDFNYPKEKIFVTYLASENIYKPLDINFCKDVMKKFYKLPSDYILYVGGFSPRKNIVGLIKAYSKLPNFLKQKHKLVIAGSKGKSYSIYKKCAEDYHVQDYVLFPGFIEMNHMPHLYNCASLFVYPSFYEGFGLPPIEAMACGIPVIASNSTSIPEIIEDAANFFTPENIDELSYKIEEILCDSKLKSDLILKGFKKSNSLSWDNTASDTLNAYKKIIKNL